MGPGTTLSKAEKEFLSLVFSNIFYSYDRDGTAEVRTKEFLSGFILLSAGSKSEKLALAFQLFDSDKDGALGDQELARFLRSFITILFALNEESARSPADQVWQIIDEAALRFAGIIFSEVGLSSDDKISFEDIANWYTDGGYERIPWLESLNLEKWGCFDDINDDKKSDEDEEEDEEEDNDDTEYEDDE